MGLLADPTRLRVVAALALGAGTIEEVSAAADLPLKDVALAARRLARGGLVHRDGHLLALHAGAYDSFMPNDPIVAHCHGSPSGSGDGALPLPSDRDGAGQSFQFSFCSVRFSARASCAQPATSEDSSTAMAVTAVARGREGIGMTPS